MPLILLAVRMDLARNKQFSVSPSDFRRKSMTGNWKTNQGSAMLEQLPITEKYKNWIDEVINLFLEKQIRPDREKTASK